MHTFLLLLSFAQAAPTLSLEVPLLRTPIARYTYGKDNVLPLTGGLIGSMGWGEEGRLFTGFTARAGRTAIGYTMAQARFDVGLRTTGDRFWELGLGAEAIRVWGFSEAKGFGGGPMVSLNQRIGSSLLLGGRLTTAVIPGGFTDDSDIGDFGYGRRYFPSNATLSVTLGWSPR